MGETMNEEIYKIMCAHALYSFSEIDWDFDSLSVREKCIIKNQDNLDTLRSEVIMFTKNLGLVTDG